MRETKHTWLNNQRRNPAKRHRTAKSRALRKRTDPPATKRKHSGQSGRPPHITVVSVVTHTSQLHHSCTSQLHHSCTSLLHHTHHGGAAQIMAVPVLSEGSASHSSPSTRHWSRSLLSANKLSSGQHGAPVPPHAACTHSVSALLEARWEPAPQFCCQSQAGAEVVAPMEHAVQKLWLPWNTRCRSCGSHGARGSEVVAPMEHAVQKLWLPWNTRSLTAGQFLNWPSQSRC